MAVNSMDISLFVTENYVKILNAAVLRMGNLTVIRNYKNIQTNITKIYA